MNDHVKITRHLSPRVGNGRKLRSWDRQVIPDQFDFDRKWLAYRLADRTCGQTCVQIDLFDPEIDRRALAFFVQSMRQGLRMVVAEGPPTLDPPMR